MQAKIERIIIINFILLFLTTFIIASNKGYQVKLLKSDNQNFIIEANIEQYRIIHEKNTVTIDGLSWNNEFGKPCLPVRGFLLQIPAYAKYKVTILEQEPNLIKGIYIAPNPTPLIKENKDEIEQIEYKIEEDKKVYHSNEYFPNKLIELNYLGFMRNHYLMRVRINVAQYNPVTKTLKINKRIKFQLNKIGGRQQFLINNKTTRYRNESSEVFDEIIKSQVLNYSAKQPDTQKQLIKMKQDTEGKFEAVEFYRKIADLEKYKITVNREGIYKLTYSYLNDAGINLTLTNPNKLHLYNRSKEIPIFVHGQDDERFDSSDYVLFYGESNKTIFSNDNVYWLVIDEHDGVRMGMKDGRPQNETPHLNIYKEKLKLEKNVIYKASMPNRGEYDHWTWDEIHYLQHKYFRFNLSSVASLPNNAVIKILFYGYSYSEHAVKLFMNENEIVDTTWNDKSNCLLTKSIPQSYLANGENTLTVKPYSIDSDDVILMDWFEIEYWRNFSVFDGALCFFPNTSGNYCFEINGFNSNSIELLEIRDKQLVNRILNSVIIKDSVGYALKFQTDVDTSKKYICLQTDKTLIPKRIERDEFSSLCSINQQSDYIIITHELFYESVIPLADLHREEELTADIIKVQDIYDEFNYGIFNPQAIKDFLQYTYYYWKPPVPTYVLLIGDASYDYKDNLGIGNQNYVPTHLFEIILRAYETANDNWFVSVSGEDILPDMIIGRLTVRSALKLEDIINKIYDYKQDHTHWSWKNTILLVSDNSSEGEDFETMSDNVATYFPQNYRVNKIYLRDFSDRNNCRERIIDFMNRGCLIVNYIGHGAIDLWAKERILTVEDTDYLTNRLELPFMAMLTCQNGLFQDPIKDCLAEKLVKVKNSGAIATWAATGYTFVSHYNRIGSSLYNAIFANTNFVMGSFVMQAKLGYLAAHGLPDHAEMFTLFGDPALRLNVINPEAPVVELRLEGKPLQVEEQYVPKRPLFLAAIISKHPISEELIEVILDDQTFGIDNPMVDYYPYGNTVAEVLLQTNFEQGTHSLRVLVSDTSGLKGEDRISFTIQEDQLRIINVLNYPNPMTETTYFTYELSQPAEVTIKIYTVSGRLIQVLDDYSMVPFNSIEWDGFDRDGDKIANGVYLYKVIAKKGGKTVAAIERLAKIE